MKDIITVPLEGNSISEGLLISTVETVEIMQLLSKNLH